jgi:hypothetical protein
MRVRSRTGSPRSAGGPYLRWQALSTLDPKPIHACRERWIGRHVGGAGVESAGGRAGGGRAARQNHKNGPLFCWIQGRAPLERGGRAEAERGPGLNASRVISRGHKAARRGSAFADARLLHELAAEAPERKRTAEEHHKLKTKTTVELNPPAATIHFKESHGKALRQEAGQRVKGASSEGARELERSSPQARRFYATCRS